MESGLIVSNLVLGEKEWHVKYLEKERKKKS
jgi:hypothetical protein